MTPERSDRAERQAALDPERSFIVQAPAGSGKTELLIRRFLRLLATVDQPQRILAITFTRKATEEMVQRLLTRLTAAVADEPPDAGHERETWQLARTVVERDRRLGWELMENPAQLQIHTIDGLCARLASRNPGGRRGVPAMRVTEDATPWYREAARRTLLGVATDGAGAPGAAALEALLIRLRGNIGRLQDNLAAELGRRDQWLGRVAAGLGSGRAALRERQELELRALEEALERGRIERLSEALATLSGVPADRHGPAWRHASGLAVAGAEEDLPTRLLELHRMLKAVAVQNGTPMAPRTVRARMGGDTPPAHSGAIEDIVGICDAWRADPLSSALFRRMVTSPPLDFEHGNDELLGWMNDLLKRAWAELRVLFAERGVCDFQHVAEFALDALGDDLAPGEALLIEDGRLGHVLVDEFQDTSQLQYDLLCKLTAGWSQGDGRTLFLVGDPMQSIYRFRKAEVELFNGVFAGAKLGDIGLQPLRLTSNFRSRQELVRFVNAQCPHFFSGHAPAAPGNVEFVPSRAERGPGGQVALHGNPVSVGTTGEAAQIAALVAGLQEADPAVGIGILARTRKQLAPVAEVLTRRGIAFEAVDVQSLADRPVVGDLMVLTRALLHPADRIAWLALLRLPWCGLTPGEMHTLATGRFDVDSLARLHEATAMSGLDDGVRERLQRLGEVMSGALASAARQCLSRRVEAAWIRLQGPCVVAEPVDLRDAQRFFELLARVEAEPSDDLLETLEHELARLRADSGPAAVKLMTIHKAKGLEFDVVIMPGLEAGAGGSRQELFRQHTVVTGSGTGHSLLAPVKAAGSDLPSLYDYIGTLDREAAAAEARRVLYVAMTRARRELHLFGRWRTRGQGDDTAPCAPAGSFMDLLWAPFQAAIEAAGVRDLDEPSAPPVQAGPPEWPLLQLRGAPQPALTPHEGPPACEDIALGRPDRDALALGDALHQWLQLLHDHWSDGWQGDWLDDRRPALDSSLLAAGARPENVGALRQRLSQMLNGILQDSGARHWVSPQAWRDSAAEACYCVAEGPHLRKVVMDRVCREADGLWHILDYKTGEDTGVNRTRWARQLAAYRRALAQAEGAGDIRLQVLQVAADAACTMVEVGPEEGADAD